MKKGILVFVLLTSTTSISNAMNPDVEKIAERASKQVIKWKTANLTDSEPYGLLHWKEIGNVNKYQHKVQVIQLRHSVETLFGMNGDDTPDFFGSKYKLIFDCKAKKYANIGASDTFTINGLIKADEPEKQYSWDSFTGISKNSPVGIIATDVCKM